MKDPEDRLNDCGEGANTNADLVEFLGLLRQNFQNNRRTWENDTSEIYLDGLAKWVRDMEGYYKNMGITVDIQKPTWRMFADILLAARVYE